MTNDEIRELLPLYAAGTLESNERQLVEEALKNSEELRAELKLWRHAKAATIFHADMRSEAHLTSEQIVDYANETVESGPLRLQIENHLQSCPACRKEYDIIKEMQPERLRTSLGPRVQRPMSSFFPARFKPGFVVLALALLAAIFVVIFMHEPQHRQTVNEPPKDSITVPLNKEAAKRSIALSFPYVGSVRDPGGRKKSSPILSIDEGIDSVNLVLPVQHSALASGYRVQIFSPGKRMLSVDTVIAKVSNNGMDSLKISVDAKRMNLPGRYNIYIMELLKSPVPDVDPEEYRYQFDIRPADGK